MKKFIYKIFLFFLLFAIYKTAISITLYFLLPDSCSVGVTGQNRLGQNRIVLLGSSNIVHNYDYRALNEYYGNYNFLLCSLNEPSGLFATLFQLKKLNLTKDDIVICCFPHTFYEKAKFLPFKDISPNVLSKEMIVAALIYAPTETLRSFMSFDLFDLIKLFNARGTLSSSKVVFSDKLEVQSDSLYNNCWVNPENKFYVYSTTFEREYILKIDQLMKHFVKAKLEYRFPAIRKGQYNLNKDRLNFQEKQFFFINTIETSVYEDKFWFNQWYHLNKCGRDLCTNKLIIELNSLMQRNTTPSQK